MRVHDMYIYIYILTYLNATLKSTRPYTKVGCDEMVKDMYFCFWINAFAAE